MKYDNIFLDKNIIFDYARIKIFKQESFSYKQSLILIDKILQGEIKANIDCTTVFAVYNYISYKLNKPEFRGGKGLELEVAQKTAREFVKNVFMKESWIIHGLNREHIFKAIEDSSYDLEDSWQFYAYKKSMSSIFVTWNIKHFKDNAITPKKLLIAK